LLFDAQATSAAVEQGKGSTSAASAAAQQCLGQGAAQLSDSHTVLLREVSEQHAANVAMADSLVQLSVESAESLQGGCLQWRLGRRDGVGQGSCILHVLS
jgi:hypothetical protein